MFSLETMELIGEKMIMLVNRVLIPASSPAQTLKFPYKILWLSQRRAKMAVQSIDNSKPIEILLVSRD